MTRGRGRPKVVVVAQASPAVGGIATFAESLVTSDAVRRVADVDLLNTTRQAVRRAGGLSTANVRHAVSDALRVAAAGRRADVVHLHVAPGRIFPLARAVVLCLAARGAGAGVVCHVHSSKINGGDPRGFDPGPVFRRLVRLLRVADAIPTVSDTGTEVLAGLLPTARVETVANAVPVGDFRPADPASAPVTVLFVGTLCERKGLRDLAAACAALTDMDLPAWRLRVVGGAAEVGEEEAESIRDEFRRVGLQHSLVGSLQGRPLREEFEGAGVFVLPSHWEGQPMVILEAKASGLPVVATRVGAVADTVRHGVDGCLVEPRAVDQLTDALAGLIVDSERRRLMGAAGREHALEQYDMPVLARRLESIYADAWTAAQGRSRR